MKSLEDATFRSGELVFWDLHKRFSDVIVLKGVSGRLIPGQITAFVGPNGAGKTTLFQVLTGEVQPDSGIATFDGNNILGTTPSRIARRGIGKLFQDVRAFPNLSVLDNVIVAIIARQEKRDWFSFTSFFKSGRSPKLIDCARRYLSRVGMSAEEESLARDLSWGNQKLLSFARLMAGEFRCVFLDEPVAGISSTIANHIAVLVRDLANSGVSIALIEHEMTFVEELASEVIVLNEGKVINSGTFTDVMNHAETREVCLGL